MGCRSLQARRRASLGGFSATKFRKIPALPRVAELLAVDGVPVDAWETIPLIQRLMFPKAWQSCSVKYFDGRKVATAVLRAVGVPYFAMPLFYFHRVSMPKTEFKF
jgi:hypothetical protein